MRRSHLWLGLALAGLLTTAAAHGAETTPLPAIDVNDVARLSHEQPEARALLDQGQVALARGELSQAASSFARAAQLAPHSALAARRHCEVLTRLGRKSEALAACRQAVSRQGSAMDFRASVAALMLGPGKPTSEELAQAILLARSARELRPDEPWGYAAECEIARRLNDAELRGSCLAGLERVAPGAVETQKLVRELGGERSLAVSWLGWCALLVIGLGTLAHAVLAQRRRRFLLGAITAAWLALWSSPAAAEPEHREVGALSKWPINEKNPLASLPSATEREADPVQFGYLLMDLTDRAETALKQGDRRTAAQFYEVLARAVPDSNVAFSKLCELYDTLAEREAGLRSCRRALALPGVSVDDFVRFVHVVLSKTEPLDAAETQAVDEIVRHLSKKGQSRLIASSLQCQLGQKLGDRVRLEQCSAVLAQVAPNDAHTIASLWSLAVLQRDQTGAQKLIERARASGFAAGELSRMQQVNATLTPTWRQLLREPRSYASLALLAGAGLLLVSLSRRARPLATT